jgi:hypothetical protein
MKQMNLSKSSCNMKDEPAANNIYDSQISRLLRKPLRVNTLVSLSKNAETLCHRLEHMAISGVANYHLDDSSDEEDNFDDISREEIKKLPFIKLD